MRKANRDNFRVSTFALNTGGDVNAVNTINWRRPFTPIPQLSHDGKAIVPAEMTEMAASSACDLSPLNGASSEMSSSDSEVSMPCGTVIADGDMLISTKND